MTATIYQLPTKMQQASSNFHRPALPQQPLPELARQTMEYLLALSQPQSSASQSDHVLALELLAMAGGEGSPAERATLQRINLVDHMFSQMLAEPHLSASCREPLESLRFPMIKNVLVDVGFLLQPQHPLRQIMHNTLLEATTVCTKGSGDLRQIEIRIRDLPSLVDLSANFVLPALPTMQALTDAEVASFNQQLEAQANERKQALTNMVGRAVARELDDLTLGLKLPSGVATFVQFGINPLLSAIMLKHGMDSVRWAAQMSRVQSLLSSYEPANASRATDRSGLISNLILDLTSIGMSHERIQKLISLLNTP